MGSVTLRGSPPTSFWMLDVSSEGFDDYSPCRRERCRFEHVEGRLSYYMLSFNLFKRRDALDVPAIIQLTQLIRGPEDPP
jgi:hypothetical protein